VSNAAITWAYKQQDLKAGPRFVLVTIADMADQEHSCYPGVPLLSKLTGFGQTAIREHLKTLRESGKLTVELRHKVNGARRSNRYYLPVDNSDAEPESGSRPKAGIRRTQSRNPRGRFTEPSLNPQVEQSVTEGTDGAPVDNSTDDRSPSTNTPKPHPPVAPTELDTIAVFTAAGHLLAPTGITDELLVELGHLIVDKASTAVINRTAFVIRCLTNPTTAFEWQQVAFDLVAQHNPSVAASARTALAGTPEGNDF
jgi:hypothetical protein